MASGTFGTSGGEVDEVDTPLRTPTQADKGHEGNGPPVLMVGNQLNGCEDNHE
jgi:hypothetical protein